MNTKMKKIVYTSLIVIGLLTACSQPLNTPPKNTAPDVAKPTAAASSDLPAGNAIRGKDLFNGAGTCNACHSLEKGVKLVGPSLAGIATTAATRKSGMSAKDNLRESIISPNAYVVADFQPNLMVATFGESLSKQQLADLLAYLESLK